MENIAKLIKKNAKAIEAEYLLPVFNVPEIYTPLQIKKAMSKDKYIKQRLKKKT